MLLLPLLLALPLAQDAPPPLLAGERPEGWRGERLDFPLDFAEDLKFEGYEELAFAPGMFTQGAPDYWSYYFGIRLEGEHALDAEFLDAFLTSYYVGLSKAVSGGRYGAEDFDYQVDVRRGDGHFEAAVVCVDGFVTGKPVSLRMKIDVDRGNGHTDLFAIASPAREDTKIWKDLEAHRETWLASRPPRLVLNHAYVIVDEETYGALCESEYVTQRFAASEVRDTVRMDMSYSGLYLYGTDTYLEFLPAGAVPALVEGASAIAFGFDRPGEMARGQKLLEENGFTAFGGAMTRELEGTDVPWFHIFGVQAPHAESKFSLFAMEYQADFLEQWKGELTESRGVARREVLARYKQAATNKSGPFGDITAISLALDEKERANLVKLVQTFGWKVSETEGAWVLDGPELDLVVTTSDKPGGITGLSCSLTGPADAIVMSQGALRLEVGKGKAELTIAR